MTDSPERKSERFPARVLLVAGLVALLVGAALYFVMAYWQPARLAAAETARAENAAAVQAGLIDQHITARYAQLDAFARRPEVLKHLNVAAGKYRGVNVTPALRRAEADGLTQFENATALIIVPLSARGIVDPYNERLPALTAIEIDLLKRCEDPPKLIIEAIRQNNKWMLTEVACAGAGAVVVRYPLSAISAQLKTISSGETHTELVQKFGKLQKVIARAPLPDVSEFSAESKLAVPNWRLRVFTPAQSAAARNRALLLNRLGLGLIALGALLLATPMIRSGWRARAQAAASAGRHKAARKKHRLDAVAEAAESAGSGDATDPDSTDTNFAKAVAASTGKHAVEKKKKSAAAIPVEQTNPEDETETETETVADIFRAYDIRGVADRHMDAAFCYDAGRAFGSLLVEKGEPSLLLARDGRLSSPRIHEHFLRGLISTGCEVTDMGIAPTPMAHFASFTTGIGNVAVITGSHSAPEYNGIKMSVDYQPLRADEIQALYTRIQQQQFQEGAGSSSETDVRQQYIDYICKDVDIRDGMKIVIDASNGATSEVGPHLFRALGCDVERVNCEIDGNFPGHPPDPTVAVNQHQLTGAVLEHGAELGIAFDGDGDRVVVVTNRGDAIPADALLMLLARDVCRRNRGARVIYDVKCSVLLRDIIEESGGEPVLGKSGHSHMKLLMQESEALVGGELSGHIFFRERWFGFDDGMYAAARLAEILSREKVDLHKLVAALPRWHTTPEILIATSEQRKFKIVEEARRRASFELARIIDIDGLRVEYDDRWGLLRASNTGPAISLRFQGSDEAALNQIRDEFIELLEDIEPMAALQLAEL